MTRRGFVRNLIIGTVGYIATRRIAWTADTKPLVDQLEAPTPVTRLSDVLPAYRRYNPFSPTDLCIDWVQPEPKYITHS